jgi:phosphate transport system substrate-binding protein
MMQNNYIVDSKKISSFSVKLSIIAVLVSAHLISSKAAVAQIKQSNTAQATVPTQIEQSIKQEDDTKRLSLSSARTRQITNTANFDATPGVYGSITSIGSDTLATLVSLWAERFQSLYPHVKFQIQASGSATASQALTQGTASIGPMSRALTPDEIQRFTRKYGYPPTSLIVAVDAMAIFVEKNNPLSHLSLAQIDALFSMTRFCGESKAIRQWQDLGVGKFGDSRNIELFGRNSASGTYDLFKHLALCDGDYDTKVNEMPSSSSVVQSVASSIGGMGYAALGHGNNDVKALAIGKEGGPYFPPSPQNIMADGYPFTRYLYIVVNKAPGTPLPTLEKTFLSFILSEQGQEIVEQGNYYPVSGRLLERQRRLLE